MKDRVTVTMNVTMSFVWLPHPFQDNGPRYGIKYDFPPGIEHWDDREVSNLSLALHSTATHIHSLSALIPLDIKERLEKDFQKTTRK